MTPTGSRALLRRKNMRRRKTYIALNRSRGRRAGGREGGLGGEPVYRSPQVQLGRSSEFGLGDAQFGLFSLSFA